MKKSFAVLLTLALLALMAAAQTTVNSQTSASGSESTSVSADRSGINAQSDASAQASEQTSVSQQERKAGDNDVMDRDSKRPQPRAYDNDARSDKDQPAHPEHKASDKDSNKQKSPAGTSASGQAANASTLQAVLSKPVDARKNKPGDQVVAKTTQNMQTEDGVVIPKGSRLIGHVTEAKARSKDDAESRLGIVFDHALLKDGHEVPMNATIQALGQAQSALSADSGDASMMGSAAGSGAVSSGMSSGGGLLRGVSSTVGATTGTVADVGGNAAGAAGGTLHSATAASGSLAGSLSSSSKGVFGMPGLSLSSAASNSLDSSVIMSNSKNVRLDSGTQMILHVVSQ